MCAHLLLLALQIYKTLNKHRKENVGSHKKDTPHPRAKEKPHQDGRRGEITFRIKPHTLQRCWRTQTKPCVHQDPETPQRLSQNCLQCLSVCCRGTGQHWPVSGALGTADLGHTACGISPLGGGCHKPHHKAAEQMNHKLQNNYTK